MSDYRWLGKGAAPPPAGLDPGVLDAIERSPRPRTPCPETMEGSDHWLCHEVSHLDAQGWPVRLRLLASIPCHSPRFPESKSFKLYLAGAHALRLPSTGELARRVAADLETLAGAKVRVRSSPVLPPPPAARDLRAGVEGDAPAELGAGRPGVGQCCPEASGCRLAAGEGAGECCPDAGGCREASEGRGGAAPQRWFWGGFRCLCPVTGQPDWARATLALPSPANPGALLGLLASYRECRCFHEEVCEDIHAKLAAEWGEGVLGVSMQFVRRGGISIQVVRHRGLPRFDAPAEEA